MVNPILLLRLEGPLQSWGTRARWDVRDTSLEPTKSGIVGMLGCALGYPMGDPRLASELDRGLIFGVRTENPGVMLTDFQTITAYLPNASGGYKFSGGTAAKLAPLQSGSAEPATIISPRAYLADAEFLVALQATNPGTDLITRCAEALQNPVWPIFLGRKACVPTRPVFEAITTEYADVSAALRKYPLSTFSGEMARLRSQEPPVRHAYVEDVHGNLTRQDSILGGPTRLYGIRRVTRLELPVETQEGSHGEEGGQLPI